MLFFLFKSSSFIRLKVWKKLHPWTDSSCCELAERLSCYKRATGKPRVRVCSDYLHKIGTGKLQNHFKGKRIKMVSPHISHCTYFVNFTTAPFKHFLSHIQDSWSGEKYTDKPPDPACTVKKCWASKYHHQILEPH